MFTLLTPYIVVGRMIVRSGVSTRGVDGPKTAIVEGANTRRLLSRAISITFSNPTLLTRIASCGFFSPVPDRIAARCT